MLKELRNRTGVKKKYVKWIATMLIYGRVERIDNRTDEEYKSDKPKKTADQSLTVGPRQTNANERKRYPVISFR